MFCTSTMHLILQVEKSQTCQSTNLKVPIFSSDKLESDDHNSDINYYVASPTSTGSVTPTSKEITFQYSSSDSEMSSNLIQPSIKASFRNQRSYERKTLLILSTYLTFLLVNILFSFFYQ